MSNYTKEVKFTSTGNYGSGPVDEDDVYTVDQFRSLCQSGVFIDYDGFGYPVKDSKADPSVCVKPSKVKDIPADATHVVWFNR